MNIIESLNSGLESRYFLKEAKQDQDKFETLVGKDLFDRFQSLKEKGRLQSPYNDYYHWIKNGKVDTDALDDYLTQIENTKTRKEKEDEARAGAKEIYNTQQWRILKINTFEASAHYGKNTNWCITGEVYDGEYEFNTYSRQGIKFYFIMNKQNQKDKWCYLDYGSYQMLKTQEILYDSSNQVYYFGDMDEVIKKIPEDVLYKLPWLDRYLDQALESADKVKDKVDANGVYYYNGRDRLETLNLLRGKVTKIIIGNNVTEIPYQAFSGYSRLTEVEFESPSRLRTIGSYAFLACVNLKSIKIPSSVEYIDSRAFMYNFELSSFKFENNSRLRTMGRGVFDSDSKIGVVLLPDGQAYRN